MSRRRLRLRRRSLLRLGRRPRGLAVELAAVVTAGVVLAMATSAAATAAPRTVDFAGHRWAVKASAGQVGPGPNVFSDDPENVWVDGEGRLHLRLTYGDGQWRSAEVILGRSLGHGTYTFTLASAVGRLDPNVVLGLFTWSDDPAHHHREIDIEFARWGDPAAPANAQYVVQPYDRPGNLVGFSQPDVPASTHGFTWTRRHVTFESSTGSGPAVARWKYRGPDVPPEGDERVRVNLWLRQGLPPTDGREVEVVLSDFSFRPR